ncbi:ABC1 family domain containing protein [Musa troglodytarum]|uniref:ABC1 family domain containing protein n=1 Tax=Musa troglodytarum TaxID=320322 RepID=A0A9E7IHI6_9LILI|nr:ABC1 family domain containing protein [Musa troglodytarum]URE48414.1 ABC1 family domain containing protein [Musa troglodytarum]
MPSSSGRELQGPEPPPLKVGKDSWRVKKPAASRDEHERRVPVVVYLHTPKVIHASPQDFMSLVQRLTGKPSSSGSSRCSTAGPDSLRDLKDRIPVPSAHPGRAHLRSPEDLWYLIRWSGVIFRNKGEGELNDVESHKLVAFFMFLVCQKIRKVGYSFLANSRANYSTNHSGLYSTDNLPLPCRLFSQYKVFCGQNNLFLLHKAEENVFQNNLLRKFSLLSARSSMTYHAQVAWKRLCALYSYRGITSSPLSRIVCTTSLALTRSHLVPSILAFVAGEIALSKTAWADGEYFPSRNGLYMCGQDSHIFLTFILLALECLILFFRTIYLTVLFSPIIMMSPLADSCGSHFRKMWLHLVHATLENAGPAFIKWGQWAATRPDLFPGDLCTELAKLHTKAPAHSFAYTRKSIEKAFGHKLSDVFENFEEEPVASGSVAQVHRASLRFQYPGQRAKRLVVAVKVRHPGVGESIRRDFTIINLAAKISNFMPTLRWLRLDESVQQFAVFMMSQVDLSREAAHLNRFIYNFRRWKDVSFPKPLYPFVHPAVLVETYEHGESVSHYVDELEGHDRLKSALAHIGTHALLKMLLVDNFIHADMHPGNILVRAQTKRPNTGLFKSKPHVVFLDVGMTAELSSCDRVNLLDFFKAVALRDGRTAAECTLKLSKNQNCPNPKAFIEEVEKSFSFWGSSKGDSVHPAECMHQLLEQVRRHKVNIDGNVCTVMVTTLVLEGWQRKLDPDYDVMQTLQTLLFRSDWAQSLSYTIEGLMAP